MALFGSTPTGDNEEIPVPVEPVVVPDGPVPSGVEDYRRYLLTKVRSLRPFGIGLREACGLTLCESIVSDIDLPICTTSAVDGWAVRASNLVGASPEHVITLPVVGQSVVGDQLGQTLSAGTAIRIEEFAPVPEGADAVVPLAAGFERNGGVQFVGEVTFHENLQEVGNRVADGDSLLSAGTVIDPRMIAMLAEVGLDKVLARPKPRTVVGAIGAELVDAGVSLTRITQTYDAATPMIATAAQADGAESFAVGVLPGSADELKRALSEQLIRADLILLSADATPELAETLSEMGDVETNHVDMTPSGSFIFGMLGFDRVPLLVLPRDVVSAYIAYELFGRALVRTLAGTDPGGREVLRRRVSEPLPFDEKRTQYVLALNGNRGVRPVPLPEDAGGVELAYANALIIVPPNTRVEAEDEVDYWLLSE